MPFGRVDHTQPPTENSDGKRVRSFEFLSLHLPQIKNLKLSMTDSHGQGAATVDLKRQSDMRASQAVARMWNRRGLTDQSSIEDEIKISLKEVGTMAQKIGDVLGQRLLPPDAEYIHLRFMAKCLDFTEMISGNAQDYCSAAKAKRPLERLYDWLQTRFDGSGVQPDDATPIEDMPPFDDVWAQFCELAKRLQAASGEASYRTWKGASGVVIMKNVFTEQRFYVGCEDYLYLWLHMACKSMCEAVVEGMGGVWDRCNRQGTKGTLTCSLMGPLIGPLMGPHMGPLMGPLCGTLADSGGSSP